MLRQHKFPYQTRTSPSNGDDPFHVLSEEHSGWTRAMLGAKEKDAGENQ